MQLLLDTHTLLWWVNDAEELSAKARKAIANGDNDCFLGLASCREISIKCTTVGPASACLKSGAQKSA